MSTNNNPVIQRVLSRQELERLVQEEERRSKRFNLTDLHTFFYKKFVERGRPAEEEHDKDVASSPAEDHQEVDFLDDAAYPEFSLFGHLYPEITDTDSDSSTEVFPFEEVTHEAAPGESTGGEAPSSDASTDEAPTAHTAAGAVPSIATVAETSIIDSPTAVEYPSAAGEWLVCEPEGPANSHDTGGYDSDQWGKMAGEVDTSAQQSAASTGNQSPTTPIYPRLPPERQSFLQREPDSTATEPFPPYCETNEDEASYLNDDLEQAYTYALSKVADESIRSEEMSFRHPSMATFAGRIPHPNISPNVNPDFNPLQGPGAWLRTPVRARNTSRFFPGGNTPTRARYAAAQSPQSKPSTAVTHSMRASESFGQSSSSTAAHPNDPASKHQKLTEEAVRRGRVSTADKKNMTFNAMTEMLLDSEINDELRSKFSALSNDVLRLELSLFQTPEASTGTFLSPKTIEQITPIAHAFIEYLGFLDQTLQKEARDAQAVKVAVVQAASEHNASPEIRFRGMTRPILRNLKRPRPAEHRILQIFVDLFDAYVYSDFLNIYNYQVIHDTVLYNERMAVSRLLISIWTILQRTVDNYKAIMLVNDELKTQFISPAMATVADYKAIWDDENLSYRQEVDGGVRLGM